MHRPRAALFALLVALGTWPGTAAPQPNANDLRSGCTNIPAPTGTNIQPLYVVPAGYRFVLTDLGATISRQTGTGGYAYDGFLEIRSGTIQRWNLASSDHRSASAAFHTAKAQWTSGLVFSQGDTINVRSQSPFGLGGGDSLGVCWSGYLVPLATSAVDGAPPSSLGLGLIPNPSGQQVTLRFELGRAADVALEIFDVQGRRVRTLARGRMRTGAHDVVWDGRDAAGAPASLGTYFARLTADDERSVRRLIRIQ